MINDRQSRTDELIRTAGDYPEIDPQLRKRVLRAARQAHHRRLVRRRVQWALGGSAAAIVLAAVFSAFTTPESGPSRYAPSAMNRSAPTLLRPSETSSAVEKPDRSAHEKRAARAEHTR